MRFLSILLSVVQAQEYMKTKNGSVEIVYWPLGTSSVLNEAEIGSIDSFDVYVGSYVMQRWRGRAIWNLYHGGIVFSPSSEDISDSALFSDPASYYTIDYNALNDEDIVDYIVPSGGMSSASEMVSWVFGFVTGSNALELQWKNLGQLRLTNRLPPEYTNLTRIGRVDRGIFLNFRKWAASEWVKSGDSFDLFTVVSADWKQTFLRARICHEFVQDAIDWLSDRAAIYSASEIWRDVIVFYAENVHEINWTVARERRDALRFLRVFASNWEVFSASFSGARDLAGKVKAIGLKVMIYSGGKFYWINMSKELMNYCYLQMKIGNTSNTLPNVCIQPHPETEGPEFEFTMSDRLMQLEIFIDDVICFVIHNFYTISSAFLIILTLGTTIGIRSCTGI